MSTRATYSFENPNQAKTYIYIHYDGYPQGAAMYFYNTLMNESKGNFATQFIRANPQAELTRHHDQHGDTEYSYDVSGNGTKAIVEAYKHDDERKCFFTGKLVDFITQYQDNSLFDFQPFKEVEYRYSKQLLNSVLAKKALEHPISHLNAWKGRFEGSGNWNSCVEDARAILAAFPNLMTNEIEQLLS